MRKGAARIAIIAVLAAAVIGAFFLLPQQHATAAAAALTQTYRDDGHNFSLQYPDGYTAAATPTDDADLYFVHLQKPAANIQITITPAPDDGSTLTTENVVSDYPYIADMPTEPFTVTPDVTGLAFSDEAGRSPDQIWFEHGGFLYQFAAYGSAIEDLPTIAHSVEFH